MGALNIYKVDENKYQEFMQALDTQMQMQGSQTCLLYTSRCV